MGLEIKQSLKLSQQLVMTPQLQQAIKLLQLSRLELAETINQELLENPMLEESEDSPSKEDIRDGADDEPYGDGEGETEKASSTLEEVTIDEKAKDDFDWENYLGEYSSAPASSGEYQTDGRETPSYENFLTKPISLHNHLIWQLRLSALSEEQMEIGAEIIGNIEASGYLKSSLEEIAQTCKTGPDEVEAVLQVVQRLDPVGVAARDLRECLLVQAVEAYPAMELVHDIIEHHLEDLEMRRYQNIARQLKVSIDQVAEALEIIRSLDPKPGHTVSDEAPQYITPDIYVYKIDDKYEIVLNEDGLPKLKVNNFYRNAMAKGATSEAKDYVQGKLRSALWLIRSIHQRQRTIYKVTESIVKYQKEFLDKGIAYLRPMVLREVADDVGMHESTISRVTTNKYVHTPRGVFELKFFFNSGIGTTQGGSVASEAVKERIRKMVSLENQAKPLSDQAIADLLKKEDINIARRTVAKYRDLLGILPSSRRKRTLMSRGGKGHPKKDIDNSSAGG